MHRVETERRSGVALIAAHGELDAFAAPDLERALHQADSGGRVVVDLEKVSFLDSTALGVVVRALRELGEHGGDARVILPGGSARRIFEITTLDRVMTEAANRDQAIAAVMPPA